METNKDAQVFDLLRPDITHEEANIIIDDIYKLKNLKKLYLMVCFHSISLFFLENKTKLTDESS